MTNTPDITACADVHAFLDDELDDVARASFCEHLATCRDCAIALPRLLALMDAVESIGNKTRSPHCWRPISEGTIRLLRDGAKIRQSPHPAGP